MTRRKARDGLGSTFTAAFVASHPVGKPASSSKALKSVEVETDIIGSISQRALLAIRPSGSITSLSKLNEIIAPAIATLGFEAFGCILLSVTNSMTGVRLLFGKGLGPWARRYSKMAYERYDAAIDECYRSIDAFYWSEMVARRDISTAARRVLDDARTFGFNEGFVAPIHKPNGSIFVVLFVGHTIQRVSMEMRSTTHMLATFYGLSGLQLCNARRGQTRNQTLTARQGECLRWARAGKSSTVIGAIIGISPGVVDEHIEKACRRLGVATRVQAVITASELGFLDA